MPQFPFDLGKIVNSIGTVIAKSTNPYMPLLLLNLLVNTFTLIAFFLYREIWIWIPAIILLVFSIAIYLYFALNMPHMLSSTSIQKFGMQLAGLGEKDKELPEDKIEAIPSEEYMPAVEDKLSEGKR